MSRRLILAALASLACLVAAVPSALPNRCSTKGTAEILAAHRELAALERSGNATFALDSTIEVDVYFHVVAASTKAADGYIPQSQLDAQLKVMNDNFAPHGIHFNLISTEFTVNSGWSNDMGEMTMKRTLRKGDYRSLNLYFQKYLQQDAFGYCYYPETTTGSDNVFIRDGCTIKYSTVPGGTEEDFNEGKTVTHEVGHWFGLIHTFGEAPGSCTGSGSDDEIADTPVQKSPTSGCPEGRDSCPQPLSDPIHNYMDYSTDICYEEFTPNQQTRMYSMWDKFRA